MIETSKPRLEDLPEGEQLPAEDEKVHFPVAGVIVLSTLIVFMIACVIVIVALTSKNNPIE